MLSDTEFTHDLEAMRDMNREEPMNTYDKPDQIPIKGYVQTEIKPKAPPDHVEGNADPQIKRDYDEDGVRRIGLTHDEKTDAMSKEEEEDPSYKGWILRHWGKVLAGGLGAGLILLWKACSN